MLARRIWAALALALIAATGRADESVKAVDICPVWAGHPVGFCLLTAGRRQFAAFYDADRNMTVGIRDVISDKWHLVRLPSKLGWDSHNSVTLALDAAGCLHLAGNMHAVPLVYFRTTRPYDIDSFERVASMVGRNESRCTYPQFMDGPGHRLLFTYRDGVSGSGNQIWNAYDPVSRSWSRLLDTPLTDGQGHSNAYFVGPKLGPDGWFHLCWVWRNTGDCATNHDLSYARSRDLVHWQTSSGNPLKLPITQATAEVVDPVPTHGGVINGNTLIGFDSRNRPILSYHKFDAAGHTQIYNARLENGRWRIYQMSDWSDYRWDFSGGGSIPFEVHVGAAKPYGQGKLLEAFARKNGPSGQWEIDEATMKPLRTLPAPQGLTGKLARVESPVPAMEVRTCGDSGRPAEPGVRYLLRWETLPAHRDQPRNAAPPPSILRLLCIRTPKPSL